MSRKQNNLDANIRENNVTPHGACDCDEPGKYNGITELCNSEVMRNYNSAIVELAGLHIQRPKTIIDFGAGIGTLSLLLKKRFNINPLCIEIDQTCRSYLESRGFKTLEKIQQCNGADLIFSSNVLEHIYDDESVLRCMRNKLNQNGIIYLYLPAKRLLWSEVDTIVGHFRRYEFDELRAKLAKSGLQIKSMHYADCIGVFASLAVKFFGYNSARGIGSVASLRFYDKWIFPVSKVLDKMGMKYVLGKNIVLVAQR